ncbi:DUF6063 family protein [Bacillus sp. FJAT-27251]|uniref:DUF6063 family protein n=1 Tax=Bacillus sp. FJAT-27251 TaxID=1684142 RepID=UPI0006A7DD9C|nr:DUF6063 family protein [Bacillus sp. FJAT-27251]
MKNEEMLRENDVSDAFYLFNAFLQEGIIEKQEMLLLYKRPEVRDLVKSFASEANTVIIEIPEEKLYLVRGLDNPYMSYTPQELRNKIGGFSTSDGNKANHLIYLIILHVLAEFYDTNQVSYTPATQFVSVTEIARKVKETFVYVRNEHEAVIEELSSEYELNLIGAARLIEEYGLGKADAKDPAKTKSLTGFVFRTIEFLKEEELISYFDDDHIMLTEKMRDLVEQFYFDEGRKEKLFSLFNTSLGVLKEELVKGE